MATHANCRTIYNITIITLRHLLGRCSLYQLLYRYILREVYRDFFCIISISRYMRIAHCIDKKAQTVHQPALFYILLIYKCCL